MYTNIGGEWECRQNIHDCPVHRVNQPMQVQGRAQCVWVGGVWVASQRIGINRLCTEFGGAEGKDGQHAWEYSVKNLGRQEVLFGANDRASVAVVKSERRKKASLGNWGWSQLRTGLECENRDEFGIIFSVLDMIHSFAKYFWSAGHGPRGWSCSND